MCVENLAVGRRLPDLTSSPDIRASTRDDIVAWDLRIKMRPTQLYIRSHLIHNDLWGLFPFGGLRHYYDAFLFSPSFVSALPINVSEDFQVLA